MELTLKQLFRPEDILTAKQLVYRLYIDEWKWDISGANPSQISKQVHPSGNFLTDIFDSVATWLGLFESNRLIATLRVLRRKDGKFEIENYRTIPEILRNDHTVEVNRMAIMTEWAKPEVFARLSLGALEYCIHQGYKTLFTTVQFPSPGDFFISLGMKRAENSEFKYSEKDPKPVSLIYMDLTNELENEKRYNILHQLTR